MCKYILTNPELVLSVMVKTGNCIRKFRSFEQANKSNTLKQTFYHMQPKLYKLPCVQYTMCQARIGILSFLQCFDDVSRMSRTASGPQKNQDTIIQRFSLKQVEEDKQEGSD